MSSVTAAPAHAHSAVPAVTATANDAAAASTRSTHDAAARSRLIATSGGGSRPSAARIR